ncbi:MAG: hypothetical protein LYZ69_04890 [Nitrososphaerales archaeon]|nr:hypothetical protein [Nitrososphaerales archaeon]
MKVSSQEYFHNYYLKNKERFRERNKTSHAEFYAQLRSEVLSHYSHGMRCQRCGFGDERALSIDHIKGDAKHRQNPKNSGYALYQMLRKKGFPDGFQVLCANCQAIKRRENQESRKA